MYNFVFISAVPFMKNCFPLRSYVEICPARIAILAYCAWEQLEADTKSGHQECKLENRQKVVTRSVNWRTDKKWSPGV
jgi:hypothetical protein